MLNLYLNMIGIGRITRGEVQFAIGFCLNQNCVLYKCENYDYQKIIGIRRQFDPIESLWSESNENVYKVCVGFSYNNCIPIIHFFNCLLDIIYNYCNLYLYFLLREGFI